MTARTHDFRATLWQMTLMGLRYLNGRRLRTVLTTLAIVFGVAMIFAINLTLPLILDAFKQNLSSVSGADLSVASVSGESFAPDAVLPRIAAINNVNAVTGILRRQFDLPVLDGSLSTTPKVDLIGVDPDSIQQVRQFVMSEGRFLQTGDVGQAVIPAGLADFDAQLKVGMTFPLITAGGLKLYTVAGFVAEEGVPSSPQIYVTLADAQAAFNQPGLINTVEVSLNPEADRDAVAAEIQQILGEGYSLDTTVSAADTFASLQIGLAVLNLLGVLALFLGAFLIFNTFRAVVIERRHDLAMLRAVGATQRQVTLMIVIESLLQGIVGTFIGLLLGYLMAQGVTSGVNRLWETYFSSINLQLQLNLSAIMTAAGLGLITAVIAGYWPARAAGRTSPIEALRPPTIESIQRTARWNLIAGVVIMVFAALLLLSGGQRAPGGAMLFLIGMVVAAPGLVIPAARLFSPLLTLWFAREGDLARGNLVRQPGRAAITGSTLMIGLAILILMAATVSALGGLVENLANRNFSSDIVLMPQTLGIYTNVVGADANLTDRLKTLPEVETVGTLRYAAARSNGQALQVLGIDPTEYPRVASFDFSQGEPEAAFAALDGGRSAIVTSLGLSALKVQLGDDFVMQTAEGPQTYRVVGVANDILTFKIAAVFISQDNLAADFHKSEDVMLMLNLKPDADKAAALADVQNIAIDYPQFTAHLAGEFRDEIIKTTNSAFYLLYSLVVLILIPAALGLLNTLTINILERTREIGVVRAVGGSRGQVRRIVTGEALLLGIFSSAMGVLVGVAMSYGFIAAFGTIGWEAPYVFPLMGIIASVVVGVMLALFASILPARSAAKLDIIRALQYE